MDNVIRDFLREYEVSNEEGTTEELYRKVLALYYVNIIESAIKRVQCPSKYIPLSLIC